MSNFTHMGLRLTLLIAAIVSASPASAQQWHVNVQAGRIRSTLDPAAASSSVALAFRYDAPTTAFRLSTGIPTSSVESLWGGFSGFTRIAFRRSGLIAGVDVAGNAFVTRDRSRSERGGIPGPLGPFDPPLTPVADLSGHALAAQVAPVIGYEHSRVQIHARAGLSRYTATFGDTDIDRSVSLADVQLTLYPAQSFALMPVVRRFDPQDEEPATYAGVSAIVAHPLGSVWASVGHWMESDNTTGPWAIGTTLRVHRRAAIEASARRDVFDPLYLQPAQTSWSVGLSLQVGGPVGSPAAPVPAAYADGRATIRLPVSESRTAPSIAGDFNGWTPTPMQREGKHWTYIVTLTPGVYNYSFVSADGTWFVPEGVPGRKDDGMGGHVAVLVVQ